MVDAEFVFSTHQIRVRLPHRVPVRVLVEVPGPELGREPLPDLGVGEGVAGADVQLVQGLPLLVGALHELGGLWRKCIFDVFKSDRISKVRRQNHQRKRNSALVGKRIWTLDLRVFSHKNITIHIISTLEKILFLSRLPAASSSCSWSI